MQYMPMAAGVGLGWTGVQAKHNGWDRILATGIGFASEVVIVKGLKYIVQEERPDGTSMDSFPSGHTASAFLGAEIVRQEYGWGWGTGAYALATGVGVLRVCHDRHHWWDTVAGAACGVLSANIGYWMLKPAHKVLGLDKVRKGPMEGMEVSFAPMYDPFSKACGPQLSVRF